VFPFNVSAHLPRDYGTTFLWLQIETTIGDSHVAIYNHEQVFKSQEDCEASLMGFFRNDAEGYWHVLKKQSRLIIHNGHFNKPYPERLDTHFIICDSLHLKSSQVYKFLSK
jgi:hypothetical protein